MALAHHDCLLEIAVNIKDKLDEIDYNEATWEGAIIIEYSAHFSIYVYRPITPRGLKLVEGFIRIINDNTDRKDPTFDELHCAVLLYVEGEQISGGIVHSEVWSVPPVTKITHMFISEHGDHARIKTNMYRSLRQLYSSVTEESGHDEPIATTSDGSEALENLTT